MFIYPIRAHKVFRELTNGRAPKVMSRDDAQCIMVSFQSLDVLPELKASFTQWLIVKKNLKQFKSNLGIIFITNINIQF